MGQRTGDGLDGVAHVFAAAEVAGQSRQFFRWAMPCSTRIRLEECALRWRSYISAYQSGAFLSNLRWGGVITRPPVWAPRPW
ncbi:hypothetical protein GCM10010294_70610 [Streptomyces griseoloalbus]|nr:hypothetical protein GCM10010294_70610 [Streptomyces griseoloalbus]